MNSYALGPFPCCPPPPFSVSACATQMCPLSNFHARNDSGEAHAGRALRRLLPSPFAPACVVHGQRVYPSFPQPSSPYPLSLDCGWPPTGSCRRPLMSRKPVLHPSNAPAPPLSLSSYLPIVFLRIPSPAFFTVRATCCRSACLPLCLPQRLTRMQPHVSPLRPSCRCACTVLQLHACSWTWCQP